MHNGVVYGPEAPGLPEALSDVFQQSDGDDIPNSDLEYDYNVFGLSYIYRASKKL